MSNKNAFDFSRPNVSHMRAKQRKRRSNERKEDRSVIFLNSRNINESELLDDLEEEAAVANSQAAISPEKEAHVFAKPKTPVVVKEKKYLSKYIEWKRNQESYKKKELDSKKTQKKPFTTYIKPCSSEFVFGSSFTPKNHLFNAPETVKPSENPAVSCF